MEGQVEAPLPSPRPDIADDPVVVHAQLPRDQAQRPEERGQQIAVGVGQAGGRRDMPTWDRQNVRRRLRVDVAKDDYLLVLEYAIRRDLLGNDPAEKAIGLVGEGAIGPARGPGGV